MNPAEQAALAYCSVLFADIDGERLDGYEATILTLPDRRVRWLSDLSPAATATAIREADARPGVESVYLSMGLAKPGTPHFKEDGKTRRLTNDDIGALTHLWADIDIAGPGHESGKILAPDRKSVLRILDECGLKPTMIVDTGGGIHAYWMLAEPWVFAEEADPAATAARAAALVRNWQLTLALTAHRLGRWAVDSTHDFSRVLRAGGSTNRKVVDKHRPVKILSKSAATYDPSDFEAHTAEQRYLDEFVGMADWRDGETIKPQAIMAIWRMVNSPEYRSRGYMPEWLDNAIEGGILSQSDPFLKVWGKGHESGDDSTTDMSLARRVADLGLDQVDAVEIIMCRRLRTGAKVEKVDPHKRLDYVQRTVGRAFAESTKKKDAAEARSKRLTTDAQAALAAQDAAREQAVQAAAQPAPQPAKPLPPTSSADPVDMAATARSGARALGGAIAAELEQRTELRHPDPEIPAPEIPAEPPSAGMHDVDPDPEFEPPAEPEPAPEPAPEPEPGAEIPEPPAPEPPAEPEPVPPTPDLRPIPGANPSVWGSRSNFHADELDVLSQTLLGKEWERIKVWRLQQRGRGAKAERRLLMRAQLDYAWAAQSPEGYVPGYPLASGWWPAGAFDKLGGYLKAMRQDLFLNTQPVKAEDFSARFADSLVQLWEPDTSGGSLANAVAAGMASYLLAFPPVVSWPDAVAQGMPYIVQEAPRWEVSSPFVVLVRWIDFARHMRTNFSINPTPPVMAEMAELAGALPETTLTQDGKWRRIRAEYLSTDQWRQILHAAMVVELQREDRHGLRVMDGGKAEESGGPRGQREAR